MGLGNALSKVADKKCGNCGKSLYEDSNGRDRRKQHSKKDFIRCLATVNINLFLAYQTIQETRDGISRALEEKDVDKIKEILKPLVEIKDVQEKE